MARCGGGNRGCRHVNWLMYYGQSAAAPTLGYGLLYNWFAATDVRGVAPDGWRVPSEADFNTLITTVGASNATAVKGTRQSPEEHPRWSSGAGTDILGAQFYPAGRRNDSGAYNDFGDVLHTWSTTEAIDPLFGNGMALFSFSNNIQQSGATKQQGQSIRCLRDTEPPAATATDIDGNIYNWVQIGTQYWLANNLKTTKYNNGDSIATGLDDAAWAATTDGAWTYPNGDQNLPI